MPERRIDTDALSKAISGNRDALEDLLLQECEPLSRHIACRIPQGVRRSISVEDILQQTMLQAFSHIQRFEPRTPGSFSVWLKKIAENQLNNSISSLMCQKRGGSKRHLTRAKTDAASSLVDLVQLLSDDGATPSGEAMQREAVNVIRVAIASLPEDQRQAARLHFIEARTVEETAAVMGRTLGAVRGLLQRAKYTMHAKLGRSSKWLASR